MNERFWPVPEQLESRLAPPSTLRGRVSRWLLRRLPVGSALDFAARKVVPEHRYSFCYATGGMALLFFMIQLVTGVLLMVYYRPGQPWASVQRIVMEVPYGALIRSIHHWGGNLMILAVFAHLAATLLSKAYRPPRELTWITGIVLFLLALTFGFSGYLLPWTDLSMFATRVVISEMEKVPVVGGWMAGLVRGGSDVTIDTIGRFYTLHVAVLPLAVLLLIGIHLLFVQIYGVSEPDGFVKLPPERKRYRRFFSDFLIGEIPLWLLGSVLVVALAAAWPRQLGSEAEPYAAAPEGIKPEWYFLAQYQLLKLFPGRWELLGMVIVSSLLPVVLLLIPFVDTAVPSDRRGRIVSILGVVGMIVFVGVTLWGWLA